MHTNHQIIKSKVYDQLHFGISYFEIEAESEKYEACQYHLEGRRIISRAAKITPKKMGQFVTFWKRKANGPIMPYEIADQFDCFAVVVKNKDQLGQFVFSKAILAEKGIITSANKEGKRAFRVYPPWDHPTSKQALASQKWQLQFFYNINSSLKKDKVAALFGVSASE